MYLYDSRSSNIARKIIIKTIDEPGHLSDRSAGKQFFASRVGLVWGIEERDICLSLSIQEIKLFTVDTSV